MDQLPFQTSEKKLWLSLYFHQLPLEIFTSFNDSDNKPEQNERPFVVVENGKLSYCNSTAEAHGLNSQMKIATAYALCAYLNVKERHYCLESKALLELANIAYEFSSQVCLYNPQTLLLEVSASCRLFLQLNNLLKQLNNKLKPLSVSFYVAIAETPKQAFLLSIFQQRSLLQLEQDTIQTNIEQSIKTSRIHLQTIPIDFLAQDHFSQKKIKNNLKNITLKMKKMGIKTIGELLNLPDATLGRRFGNDFLTYLYHLKGQQEDPLKLYAIADSFSIQRCFLSGLDTVEQILFPARAMLESLIRFLTSRRQMASRITWRFECFNGDKLTFKLSLSSQVQSTQQLMTLTRLKLQNIIIDEKIEIIFLDADDFLCKNEKQNILDLTSISLDHDKPLINIDNEQLEQLKDKISARLKRENHFKLQLHDEYLPEKRSTLNFVEEHKTESYCYHDKNIQQPLWLMDNVIQIYACSNNNVERLNYKGLLEFESTTERIETICWSENKTNQMNKINSLSRDYFIAKNKQGIKYWIFFDENQKKWFVHGIF